MLIVTSAYPGNVEHQTKCLLSWPAKIVTVNCSDEIEQAKSFFPWMHGWGEVDRDGREISGKPVPYLDDMIMACQMEDYAGIVNSDVYLINPYLRDAWALDAMIYGSREEVSEIGGKGEVYTHGFDYFFAPKRIWQMIPTSPFLFGCSWWDYWLPGAAITAGARVLRVAGGAVQHQQHDIRYSIETHWHFCKEMQRRFQFDKPISGWQEYERTFQRWLVNESGEVRLRWN